MSFDPSLFNEDSTVFVEQPDISHIDFSAPTFTGPDPTFGNNPEALPAIPGFRSYPAGPAPTATMSSNIAEPDTVERRTAQKATEGTEGDRGTSESTTEEYEQDYLPATLAHPYASYPDMTSSFDQQRYPMAGYPMAGYPMAGYPMAGYPMSGFPPFQYSDLVPRTPAATPAGGRTLQGTRKPRRTAPAITPGGDRRTLQRVTKSGSPAPVPRRRNPTAPVKATHNRHTKGRTLMRWNIGHDQKLALAMQYEILKQGVDFDWDAVGDHFDTQPSAEAIGQHLIKVRGWRTEKGQDNPPQFLKGRPRAPLRSNRKLREQIQRRRIKREPVEDTEDDEDDGSEYEENHVQAPVPKKVKMGGGYREEDLNMAVFERSATKAEEKKAKAAKALAENIAKNQKPVAKKETKAKKEAKASSNEHPRQGLKTVPGMVVPSVEEDDYMEIGIPAFSPQNIGDQVDQYPGMGLGINYAGPEMYQGFPEYNPGDDYAFVDFAELATYEFYESNIAL